MPDTSRGNAGREEVVRLKVKRWIADCRAFQFTLGSRFLHLIVFLAFLVVYLKALDFLYVRLQYKNEMRTSDQKSTLTPVSWEYFRPLGLNKHTAPTFALNYFQGSYLAIETQV